MTTDELPKITKANLRRVGIRIKEPLAAHWVEKGHILLAGHLARHALLDQHDGGYKRRFEEDGA